jgi:hypothetical protein
MQRLMMYCAGLLLMGSVSCRSQVKNTGSQKTQEQTVYKGVTDPNCAVEVSFGSYGSGIDGKALDKVMAAIEKRRLQHTAKNVGREGETRICLPLSEIKGRKKTAFIDTLKKIAKEGQLVSVSIR